MLSQGAVTGSNIPINKSELYYPDSITFEFACLIELNLSYTSQIFKNPKNGKDAI